jgi:transketolase
MSQPITHKMKSAIVLASHKAGEGHIASAFSILDLVWVLYDQVMRPGQDRFVLSKGHASLALYAVLIEKGLLPPNAWDDFCKFNGKLGGHPDSAKVLGVEASTGSLGHGLPMAVGMALGSRIQGSQARVFCLVGDGECNEGTVWESALLASHHHLANLTCVVDFNHSTDRALDLGDLESKFSSFGWDTISIPGHDQTAIAQALHKTADDKPTVVIANTVKGQGVKFMEGDPSWHHRAPNAEELQRILEELT